MSKLPPGATLFDLTTMDILPGALMCVGIFIIMVAPLGMD